MYASTESASTKSKPKKDELVQTKHHPVPLLLSLLANATKKARRPISAAAFFFSPEGLRGLHNGTSTARRHTHTHALHSSQQPIPAEQHRRGCKITHAKHTHTKGNAKEHFLSSRGARSQRSTTVAAQNLRGPPAANNHFCLVFLLHFFPFEGDLKTREQPATTTTTKH